jgi:hypothetical protein
LDKFFSDLFKFAKYVYLPIYTAQIPEDFIFANCRTALPLPLCVALTASQMNRR